MKANELRIGNYVMYDNCFIKVTTIAVDFKNNPIIIAHTDNWTWSSNHIHIKPIELTEEILLKCGFERIENNWKVLDVIFASLSWERLAGMTLTLEHESIFIPHIKYLHQLQNLYFILCNEELEIQL